MPGMERSLAGVAGRNEVRGVTVVFTDANGLELRGELLLGARPPWAPARSVRKVATELPIPRGMFEDERPELSEGGRGTDGTDGVTTPVRQRGTAVPASQPSSESSEPELPPTLPGLPGGTRGSAPPWA